MEVEITWEEFVQNIVRKKIKRYGSLRKAAKATGIDPAILSKILKGVYIPSYKTIKKAFPYMDIPEPVLIMKMEIPLKE